MSNDGGSKNKGGSNWIWILLVVVAVLLFGPSLQDLKLVNQEVSINIEGDTVRVGDDDSSTHNTTNPLAEVVGEVKEALGDAVASLAPEGQTYHAGDPLPCPFGEVIFTGSGVKRGKDFSAAIQNGSYLEDSETVYWAHLSSSAGECDYQLLDQSQGAVMDAYQCRNNEGETLKEGGINLQFYKDQGVFQ